MTKRSARHLVSMPWSFAGLSVIILVVAVVVAAYVAVVRDTGSFLPGKPSFAGQRQTYRESLGYPCDLIDLPALERVAGAAAVLRPRNYPRPFDCVAEVPDRGLQFTLLVFVFEPNDSPRSVYDSRPIALPEDFQDWDYSAFRFRDDLGESAFQSSSGRAYSGPLRVSSTTYTASVHLVVYDANLYIDATLTMPIEWRSDKFADLEQACESEVRTAMQRSRA